MDYLRDPAAIYARSFAIIRAEADLSALPPDAHDVAIASFMPAACPRSPRDLRIQRGFLRGGTPRACAPAGRFSPMPRWCGTASSQQLTSGMISSACSTIPARARSAARRTTRSAAAVELWRDHLAGAVVVIGNAPTAFFALLDMIDGGGPRPAAIAAFPVGFVGAAESKQELVRDPRGIPYATLLGRRGGSAMAAAVVNALQPKPCMTNGSPSSAWARMAMTGFRAARAARACGGRSYRRVAAACFAICRHSRPNVTNGRSPSSPWSRRSSRMRGRRTVILATGDPMNYGVARKLLESFPSSEMEIIPHISSFSLAAARMGWSLPDCDTLSLHGRAGCQSEAYHPAGRTAHRA